MTTYRLTRFLGHGGMGAVFQGERRLPSGELLPVACKCLHAELRADPSAVERFAQEAALGLRYCNDHPNLVSIYDLFEEDDDAVYLVMELVSGCSLRHFVKAREPLPYEVVRHIACALLGALAHLHEHGVVHRDLTPQNVLVSESGVVKLSDLGLAKVFAEGAAGSSQRIGTRGYASPEQQRGLPADGRSDLYSLGVVLCELVAGSIPEAAAPSLPADTPADLRALITALVASEPAGRPATAQAAQAMLTGPSATTADVARQVMRVCESATTQRQQPVVLDQHDAGQGVAKTKVRQPPHTSTYAPRRRPRRYAVALAALALAGVVVVAWSVRGPGDGVSMVRQSTPPTSEPSVSQAASRVAPQSPLPPALAPASAEPQAPDRARATAPPATSEARNRAPRRTGGNRLYSM